MTTTKKQVTLSENVHKFAELSQRIVVEKSVIQKYEEEMLTQQNTIKSTTEISMENCSSSRMMSSSSSSSMRMISIRSSTSTGQLKDNGATMDEAVDEENGGLQNGVTVNDDDEQEECDRQMSVEHEHESVDGVSEKMTTKMSNKMKLSKITTNGSGSESIKSNVNTPDSAKASDFLSQFSMTPTSKLAPSEVAVQRPLKPQSEMDFSVPYNIINNYFSVGVVSIALLSFLIIIMFHMPNRF